MTASPDDRNGRTRLDEALVARGLAETRSRARDAILRGTVTVDGRKADKPATPIAPNNAVAIDDPAQRYVSRGALKLAAALDHFGYEAAGRLALDVGASTGGFTEILLERGATRVIAVDVGEGQLHPRLAPDPRVTSLTGVNARDLTSAHMPEPVGAIVADLSFISLRLALPPALALAGDDAWCVALVKPQFEAGRDAVGKGGIVRDPTVAEHAAKNVAAWLGSLPGWQVDGLIPSPITGRDGNREFLLGARRARG